MQEIAQGSQKQRPRKKREVVPCRRKVITRGKKNKCCPIKNLAGGIGRIQQSGQPRRGETHLPWAGNEALRSGEGGLNSHETA